MAVHDGKARVAEGYIDVTDGKVWYQSVGEGEPLRIELAAFLAACQGRGPNFVPVAAGLHAVAVVEAAARSSAQGRMVSLTELA